ncbi:MAG TPA: thioredoxin domain-containing protein [Acidimicrobiia bacterium]|nr:thioredoxin domain-containing protein [Acidimicrobiia bacterium]
MPNRLVTSTSPYLRQHAANPVDWYEWGNEAFEAARARDVPILLSIGYSSCHWCHVMAHESFEDPATAAVMNEHFVNVKVDREERPDVDAIYMNATQAMTGRGGWPMTVFLDPEQRPFYAGTYYPSEPRHGMPSFRQILDAIREAWDRRRDEIGDQASRLTAAIAQAIPPADEVPGLEILQAAYRQLEQIHDPVHGGLGGPPKFPQQPALDFLLRIVGRPWAPKAGAMVKQTLERMAAGGIHDHVGGGFARYSVDGEWLIPHFEKMLYDNAQLARLYLRAGQVFDSRWFTEVAVRTLEYMDRDLGLPDGGFASAEDADSDGAEGTFYVWTEAELRSLLGDRAGFALARYGVEPGGNFEGASVLHHARLLSEVAEEHGLDVDSARRLDSEIRATLLRARSDRTRPGLDDKVVTAWNGLAIRAFAEAGAVLDRPELIDRAVRGASFILDALVDDRGRLLRTWSGSQAKIPGFVEDQAAMALACFSLYEATGDVEWFERAEGLARAIPTLFSAEDGGFHTAGVDAEELLVRQKDLMDNPSPSGNSLAADALVRLAAYTGDREALGHAEGAMRAGGLLAERSPSAAGHLLGVIDFDVSGAVEVAITGPEADRLARVVWSEYRPNLVLAIDRTGEDGRRIALLADRYSAGRTLAYVCEDFVCQVPTEDPQALASQLAAVRGT